MIRKLTCIVIVIFAVYACKSGKSDYSSQLGLNDSTSGAGEMPVAQETMSKVVENVSSPVEMAALIKSLGVPYSQKYLATTDNSDSYNTSFSKAFNLGIFGADLGYLNMYSKTTSVIEYITVIKKLADGINVGQFFDFSTLKRLSTNNENIDSLMYISVHSFNVMDKYLQKNNRSNLSALMVAGVWVEGIYLATQVQKDKPNKKLAENIGEQKTMLSELLIILNNYKRDKFIADLIAEINKIKTEFDPLTITIVKGEPEQVVENGMLTIKQNEKSIVNITDDQLKRIIAVTAEVRDKLIKVQ
jgi:hypothetical protein